MSGWDGVAVVLRVSLNIRGGKPKVCLCRRHGDACLECMNVLCVLKINDGVVQCPWLFLLWDVGCVNVN